MRECAITASFRLRIFAVIPGSAMVRIAPLLPIMAFWRFTNIFSILSEFLQNFLLKMCAFCWPPKIVGVTLLVCTMRLYKVIKFLYLPGIIILAVLFFCGSLTKVKKFVSCALCVFCLFRKREVGCCSGLRHLDLPFWREGCVSNKFLISKMRGFYSPFYFLLPQGNLAARPIYLGRILPSHYVLRINPSTAFLEKRGRAFLELSPCSPIRPKRLLVGRHVAYSDFVTIR